MSPIDAFEHVERARNGLVIGGMQAPWPPVLRENAHDFLELALHLRRHVGTRLAEVLEVGRREHQHLARAVVTEIIIALLILR